MVLRKESVIERLKKLETIIANLDEKNISEAAAALEEHGISAAGAQKCF